MSHFNPEHPPARPFDPGQFSTHPGVYLMKDGAGKVLYVGKAKNLRNRLRNYLQGERDSRPQIRFLLERVAAVETIVTDTEKEALILENNLIKEYRPRYNIHLRDDKTYVSIRIDPRDNFPAMQVVRRVSEDGALYFGPFASGSAVRETLKQLYRIFPLRHHAFEMCRRRPRPCLFYQIGQCSAPCHDKISPQDYAELVRGAIDLLSGRATEVLSGLRHQMQEAAGGLRYEEAAVLRDRIQAIEQTVEKQKVMIHGGGDRDVFGLYNSGNMHVVVVLRIRRGFLIGTHDYQVESDCQAEELLAAAIQRFYQSSKDIPPQVVLPLTCNDHDLLADWLSDQRKGRVTLSVPRRGELCRLTELACRNAEEKFKEQRREWGREGALIDLVRALNLRTTPRRIECYDISHLQGEATVGAMTVAIDGRITPKEYRRYEVRTLDGQVDDYAALREVLTRRLERGCTVEDLPQLLLIDGGKGQLAIGVDVVTSLGLSGEVELVAMAKARKGKTSSTVQQEVERFFRPGRGNAIVFPANSAGLKVLTMLRDEAHRCAVGFHRRKRGQHLLASELERIDGVGRKRRLALLKYFGSARRVREATEAELAQVPGVGTHAARSIYDHFRRDGCNEGGVGTGAD